MSNELWNHFDCHRCGKCCTELGLPFPDGAQGLPEVAEFLGMDYDEMLQKYYGHRTADDKFQIDEHKRKPCPFLEKRNDGMACGIYSVRPNGCRAYPIDTNFGDGGIHCPAYREAKIKLVEIRELQNPH